MRHSARITGVGAMGGAVARHLRGAGLRPIIVLVVDAAQIEDVLFSRDGVAEHIRLTGQHWGLMREGVSERRRGRLREQTITWQP